MTIRIRHTTAAAMLAGLSLVLVAPVAAQPGGGMGRGGGEHRGMRGPPGGGRPGDFAPKPIKRDRLDKPVTGMFRAADADRNGSVTVAEVRANVEARRAALIRARFERIDHDHNGTLTLAEFVAWQDEMGSAASSEQQRTPGVALIPESIAPELDGQGDRVLGRIIEPLGATTVTSADTNYDGGMSLDELLAYERARFDAIDTNHDGELAIDELRALRGEGRGGERGPGASPGGGPDER